MLLWNHRAKCLLKSELVKRGISNTDLVHLLHHIDVQETKSSIDSKISRGTFSASFFLQCMHVIGCKKIDMTIFASSFVVATEPTVNYLNK